MAVSTTRVLTGGEQLQPQRARAFPKLGARGGVTWLPGGLVRWQTAPKKEAKAGGSQVQQSHEDLSEKAGLQHARQSH